MQCGHLPNAPDGIARVAVLATSYLLVQIVFQGMNKRTPPLYSFCQAFCHSSEKVTSTSLLRIIVLSVTGTLDVIALK